MVLLDRLARLENSFAVMRHGPASHHLQAHRTGRAFNHLHRRFDRVAVEVDDLLLGDLAHLRLGHLADEAAARRLGAGGGLLAELEPAAFFRKKVTGGWRISKVNERSW